MPEMEYGMSASESGKEESPKMSHFPVQGQVRLARWQMPCGQCPALFCRYLAIPTDQLLFTVHQFHLMKGSLISLFGFNTPGMQRLSLHPLTQIFKAVFCLGYFRGGRFGSHSSSQSCHRLYIKARKRILRNKIQVLYYSCNCNTKKQIQAVLPLPTHTYISFSGKTQGKQSNLPLLPLP